MSKTDFIDKTFTTPNQRRGRFIDIIRQYIQTDRPCRVLDLGCGTGDQVFELAHTLSNADFTGVDISKRNIQVAEHKKRQLALNGRLTLVAADYMEFKDKPFDLIVSDSTLQNIDVPTDSLFSKITEDLVPGGLLIMTIPYDCLYNRLLWSVRRFFRAIRNPVTDSIILTFANWINGRRLPAELIAERVPYMYLIPKCRDGRGFRRFLEANCGLQLLAEQTVEHVSIAQPKHKLIVLKKRGKDEQ